MSIMEITIDKCSGCIYYTKINTYTTSPSTTRDELVEKYGEYYTCSKPYTALCPRIKTSGEIGCIAEMPPTIITHKCIICGNSCIESVCDECKEAMKKLKEMLEYDNNK